MSVAASGAAAQRPSTDPLDPEVFARRWRILGVLCLSLVLVVAGNSSLNVALPTLVRDLGATATELQWIVDAYAIVFAGMLLLAGAIGDRYGRKGALQAGLAIFALAALAATVSTTPAQLIATRAVMGVGAAFVMPATLSILTASFPPRERPKAIATWAGFAGAGGAIGPILSGLLLERFWWGSVFLINIPIVLVALVAGAVLLPTSRDSQGRPLDPVGGVLSMVGLGALLFGIIEGPERGWADPLTLAGFATGIAGLLTFAWWERRTDDPMLDLTWFRDRRFSVGAGTISLVFFSAFGLFFLLTQYLQFVLDYSPLTAGVATLPLAGTLILVAPRSAGLAERHGPRRVVSCGLVLVAVGLAYLAAVATPSTAYLVLLPGLLFFAAGMSLTTAPSTALIMTSLPLDKAGVGSAVNDTTREVGGSVGIAVLGSIFAGLYQANLPVAELPARLAEVARESVGAALELARQAPDPVFGERLAAAARGSFTGAFSVAFWIAAAVASLAAWIVLRYGPTREEFLDEEPEPGEPEPEDVLVG